MFTRAGGAGVTPKRKNSAEVMSEAIGKLSTALSPHEKVNPCNSKSPAKVIENRSRCYRQLGEIKSLMQSGLLSDTEYEYERKAIMNTLKLLGQ